VTERREAVVDAPVALKWLLNEPASSWARALPAGARLVAPALLWAKCANGLCRIAGGVPLLDAGRAFAIVRTATVEVVTTGLEIKVRVLDLAVSAATRPVFRRGGRMCWVGLEHGASGRHDGRHQR
jgi:predicted nucleic acid-binding protein